MIFEKIEDDFTNSELRFKVTVGGKKLIIHISEEAWEDNMGSELNKQNLHELEDHIGRKIAADSFVERIDKAGVAYRAVLITTMDN